ncbi:MAG: protein translocase subunit SecF [Oscillospiraceae bacterium]|nr:protein translocase subunit SecF [Oscillospiraceae bacterium]
MSKKNRIKKNANQAASAHALDTANVFDYISKKKVFFIVSICLIAVSFLSIIVRGIEIAIEFKGGTIINYSYTGDLDLNGAESAVEKAVNINVDVQKGDSLGDEEGTHTISVSYTDEIELSDELRTKICTALKEKYPDNAISDIDDASSVSPSSGSTFFLKCLVALLCAVLLLIVYIALRFKRIGGWSAGVCAICALLHDSIIVFGTFIICGFEIDANFMAVVLTILGYSVNSTIVIYDRIRENRKYAPKAPLADVVNASISQSKTRTLRTTITTVLAMTVVAVSALITGLDSILAFAFPLIIGMIAGAYSSLCLAPSLWVAWCTRKGDSFQADED